MTAEYIIFKHTKNKSHKSKRIEIVLGMFSNHVGIKLEINNGYKFGIFPSIWKLNTVLLNNWWVKEQSTREVRKYFQLNENGKAEYQNL